MGASANVNGMPFSPVALLVGMSYVVPNDVPTLTGYDFDGWDNLGTKIVAGDTIPSQPENTIVTLKARWKPHSAQSYKVIFDENKPVGVTDAVTGMPADITTAVGTATIVPNDVPALAGYDLDGWDNSGTKIAAGASIASQPANTVVTLKATWKQQTYKVSLTRTNRWARAVL